MLNIFATLFNNQENMVIPLFIPFWLSAALIVGVIGCFVLYCEKVLPIWLTVLFKYGKTLATLSNGERNAYSATCMKFMMVKKKYFSHFYAISAFIHFILLMSVHYYESETRAFLRPICKIIFGDIRFAGSPRYFFFGLTMLQITRRYLECVLIAVNSINEINIIHYFTGIVFYLSIALFNANNLIDTVNIFMDRTWTYPIGILLYAIGQLVQFCAHRQLANLRLNPDSIRSSRCNNIIRQFNLLVYRTFKLTSKCNENFSTVRLARRGTYYFPDGWEFKFVSCPNYTGEIIIYTSLYLLSGYNYNWLALYIWVIVNQIISALLTHRWYQTAFAELYPANRRAIIPFLL